MGQKVKARFQVIGACARMQRISLEDELKLIDGTLYDINFLRDFTTVWLDGSLIKDISVSDIIETLNNSKKMDEVYITDKYNFSAEECWNSQKFWKEIDKYMRKEKRKEMKERNRKRPKSVKEAEMNFLRIYHGLMG